jgi:drug/metabolite transporter (DMT)-like permease
MSHNLLLWLIPAIIALFSYGIAQGLVKKYIADVLPARFCLFFVAAKAAVNMGYFLTQAHPNPFSSESRGFLWIGLLAYLLDGSGWILYYKSIVLGPITIVGTLSAAYPATTVVFAALFLEEILTPIQYVGVSLVILSCVGLSIAPSDPNSRTRGHKWIFLAAGALIIWGAAQTLVKYAYTFPEANEANMALFSTIGGALTLGVYGMLYGRATGNGSSSGSEWLKATVPMCMMAGGDLGVIVASRYGKISIVTPLTAAYPVVTLVFAAVALKEKITPAQWLCIIMTLIGMYLSPNWSG